MKKVLILDANQRSALAVTRSLGQRGVPLVTADELPTSLAGSSRYSISYQRYPSPRLESESFIRSVHQIALDQNIDILLPMTELTSYLLMSNQNLLSSFIIPFSDNTVLDKLSDKSYLMKLAYSLEIPIPQTWYVDRYNDLPFDLENLPYPLIVKPQRSWCQFSEGWARNAVRIADNPKSAEFLINSSPEFNEYSFLLQERVPGIGKGIFAIYNHGKPVAFFAHRRIREKPPSGGVSVLSESVEIDKTMLNYTRKLLDQACWHGVAMIEFKYDENKGIPYLMEINTRFWGSLQLAIDAGVDFPWLLYQIACGDQPDSIDSYKIGIRSRWLLGDIDNLYLTLRSKDFTIKQKISALFNFCTPSKMKTYYEINKLNDMGPFWYEIKEYYRNLTR